MQSRAANLRTARLHSPFNKPGSTARKDYAGPVPPVPPGARAGAMSAATATSRAQR